MFYNLLNYYIEKKIFNKRLLVRKRLVNDLHEQEDLIKKHQIDDKATSIFDNTDIERIHSQISVIKERIAVDDSYSKVVNYFQHDEKRRYVVNQNFMKYIDAINYLYKTSAISVSVGIYTAPDHVYIIINEVKNFFNELEEALAIK